MPDSKADKKKVNLLPNRLGTTTLLILVLAVGSGVGWLIDNLDGTTVGALISVFMVIIATVFIRTKERKITKVELDERAQEFVRDLSQQHLGVVRLLAQKFGSKNYDKLEQDARRKHSIQKEEGNFIFVEVEPINGDSNDCLRISGHEIDKHRVLRCKSPAVADAIAALLLHLRDEGNAEKAEKAEKEEKIGSKVPHIYMSWSEVHPLAYALKYALFGEGETAPLIREELRRHEPEPNKRPIVHVA